MRRDYCDRCHTETTHVASSAVHVVEDADLEGNGTTSSSSMLCRNCYQDFCRFLSGRVVSKEWIRARK